MGEAYLNGGDTELVALAEDAAVRVPDGVPLEQAAIVTGAIGTQLDAIRHVMNLL